MKKLTILIILIISIYSIGYTKVSFFLDLSGSYLKPSDSGYAKIFGEKIFYPEVILGIKLFKDIFFYGGYGFFDIKGNIIEAGEGVNTTSNQKFISIGIGYEFMAKKKISLKLSGGVIFVSYEGKAYLSEILLDNDSGKKTGFKFDIGLFYNFTKNFNVNIIAGYCFAENTEDYYRKLSYGGLKAGIGLGIRL